MEIIKKNCNNKKENPSQTNGQRENIPWTLKSAREDEGAGKKGIRTTVK